MRTFVLLAALVVIAGTVHADDFDKALKAIRAGDIQKHQMILASDAYEGRESGAEGGHKAAMYIVDHLAKLGFEPGGQDGSWFQGLTGSITFGDMNESNYLKIFRDKSLKDSEVYKLNEAFVPMRTCRAGVAQGEIVFAGYGITAPEYTHDDYKNLKVKDCIVLVLDHEPQEKDAASAWNGDKPTKYSDWKYKIANAEEHGAIAVMIVMDPLNHDEPGLPKFEEFQWPADARLATCKLPVVYVTRACADALAKAAATKPVKDLQADIDKGFQKSFRVSRPCKLSVAYKGPVGKGQKNILALWRGSDEKLKEEYVVIGAHYDHVGYGKWGSNGGKAGQIHNGADDNGSGTSTLLDVAESVVMTKFKRSILLMWFDAEERGLNGSKAWCGSPTVRVDSVVGMLNLDMIGRNDVKDIKVGVERNGQGVQAEPKYPKLVKLMEDAEKTFGLQFDWKYVEDQQLMQRSDHWSFMQVGVPATFFTGGLHGDYHTERDDPEKINYPKEELTGKIAFWMANRMANMEGNLK